MRIYFLNPGQSTEFEIEGSDYESNSSLDNDFGDGFAFKSHIGHIQRWARIRVMSDSGDPEFIGFVYSIEYATVGGKRRYNCIASEALLQNVTAPGVIYPGGIGLTLSDVFSFDSPQQTTGAARYGMGLGWLSRSKICDGQDAGLASWSSEGVGTLSGWGPLVAGRGVYFGGRLLTPSTLSAINAGGTHLNAIQGGDLYLRGAGYGDRFGVIASDGWAENYIRLGDVYSDDEIEAQYDARYTSIWTLIRDLVEETGQYIVWRREADGYVYMDISASPKARGSEAAPFASLHIADDFGVEKLQAPKNLQYACVLGLGYDSGEVWGERYGAAASWPVGKAWMVMPYSLDGARAAPNGNLDGATEDVFAEIHQMPPIEISLYRKGFVVGDWLKLDLGRSSMTGQIRDLSKKPSSAADVATVGSPALSQLTAYLERTESAAIEAYRAYRENVADGEAIRYGWFGATETFSDHFVTIDWSGESVPILLSIEIDDIEDIESDTPAVFFIININDTKIKLPWMPWGTNPITDFDIGQYCHRDGSEETFEISIEDPAGWIPDDYVFKVTITGLGADSEADPVTLNTANSTLNDMSTSTYFNTTSMSTSTYKYGVDDMGAIISKSMTIRVWMRSAGSHNSLFFSDLGRYSHWYGQASTVLYVGGSYYYGSWIRNASAAWNHTDYADNPATGNPWTIEEINSIQAGGRIRIYNSDNPGYNWNNTWSRLYDAYVEILP